MKNEIVLTVNKKTYRCNAVPKTKTVFGNYSEDFVYENRVEIFHSHDADNGTSDYLVYEKNPVHPTIKQLKQAEALLKEASKHGVIFFNSDYPNMINKFDGYARGLCGSTYSGYHKQTATIAAVVIVAYRIANSLTGHQDVPYMAEMRRLSDGIPPADTIMGKRIAKWLK